MEEREKINADELEDEPEAEGTAPEEPEQEPEEALEDEENPEDEPEGPEDIDHKKQLEELEEGKPRSEIDKAKRALHFNAKRYKDLGGDPAEILGKPKSDATPAEDRSYIDYKFAEMEAKNLAKTEDEAKVILWYVENKGLTVEDAHVLANKGKLKRTISEIARSKVAMGSPTPTGRKSGGVVPKRTDVDLLAGRGLHWNPKTKTYQGKFTEEYYDHASRAWKSRKLQQ